MLLSLANRTNMSTKQSFCGPICSNLSVVIGIHEKMEVILMVYLKLHFFLHKVMAKGSFFAE